MVIVFRHGRHLERDRHVQTFGELLELLQLVDVHGKDRRVDAHVEGHFLLQRLHELDAFHHFRVPAPNAADPLVGFPDPVKRYSEGQANPMFGAIPRDARILLLDTGPVDHVGGNQQLLEPRHVPVHQFDDLGKVVPQRGLPTGENDVLHAGVDGVREDGLELFRTQRMGRLELPDVAHRAAGVAPQVDVDVEHRRRQHAKMLRDVILVQVPDHRREFPGHFSGSHCHGSLSITEPGSAGWRGVIRCTARLDPSVQAGGQVRPGKVFTHCRELSGIDGWACRQQLHDAGGEAGER